LDDIGGLQLYTSRSISPQMFEKCNANFDVRHLQHEAGRVNANRRDLSNTSQKLDPQIIYSSIEKQNKLFEIVQTDQHANTSAQYAYPQEGGRRTMDRQFTQSTLRDQNAIATTSKSIRNSVNVARGSKTLP